MKQAMRTMSIARALMILMLIFGLNGLAPFATHAQGSPSTPASATISSESEIAALQTIDTDSDGTADDTDNCVEVANADQLDTEQDGIGDACDSDDDGDSVLDDAEVSAGTDPLVADSDNDGVSDGVDNCALVANPGQEDADSNGAGDACDTPPPPDTDADGIADDVDNCPAVANADQTDVDADGIGDACAPPPAPVDGDGDGVADEADNCLELANPDQADADGDGIGDACDTMPNGDDADGDAIPDDRDNCPAIANPDQADADGDGIGDVCESKPGTLVIANADDQGDPILGTCFDIYRDAGDGQPGEWISRMCDYMDGEDGTTQGTLEPGAYVAVQSYAPQGHLGTTSQAFTISSETETRLAFANSRLGSLIVHKVDESGNDLLGACFQLFSDAGGGDLGDFVTERCDWYDGAEDARIMFDGIGGALVLVESTIPTGYLLAPNAPVVVAPGATKDVTITDPRGATVVVQKVDLNGQAVTDDSQGACFQLWSDDGASHPAEYFGETCDANDGANDGVLSFVGIPSGTFIVIETRAPTGFLLAANTPVPGVLAGKTTTVTVVDPMGGTLIVRKVDDKSKPLPGSCFTVYDDAGGGALGPYRATACDEWDGADDGSITLRGLGGKHVLVEWRTPAGYLAADNWTFSIKPGATKEKMVKNRLGSILVVHKVDEDGEPLLGSGFDLWTDAGNGQLGTYIGGTRDEYDGANDGTMTFIGLASGNYVVREFQVPYGYLGGDLVTVRVKAGKTSEITVTNRLGATLVVRTFDAEGNPLLPRACFNLFIDTGGGAIGDRVAFGCSPGTGTVEMAGLRTGDYVLRQSSVPFGYVEVADQLVHLTEGSTTTLDLVNVSLGKVVLHIVDQDGNTLIGACFEVSLPLGYVAISCDGEFPDGDGNPDGYVTFNNLNGDHVVVQTDVLPGYIGADEFTVHVEPGEVQEVEVLNRLGGVINVRSIDEEETLVPYACYDLYTDAGDGIPADFVASRCDFSAGNADAITVFDALEGGNYVVVETAAPEGFEAGPNQAVSVALGETTTIDVVNHNLGMLVIHTINSAGESLLGACFDFFADAGGGTRGEFLGERCDWWDNLNDGFSSYRGLGTADIILVESEAPTGYAPGPDLPVHTEEGTTTSVDVVNEKPKALYVAKVDEDGQPLPGSCFAAYVDLGGGNQGSMAGYGCDVWDGVDDGEVRIFDLPTGSYILVEESVPSGYLGAAETLVVFTEGVSTTVTVVNRLGGTLLVRVTDEAGNPIISEGFDSCVTLYVDLSGALGDYAGQSCDYFDERDGAMTINGIETGDFVLVQLSPPAGYLAAANQSVHIDAGQPAETTIVNKLGGVVAVANVDAEGSPLLYACFEIYLDLGGGELGPRVGSSCDLYDGLDGTTQLIGLETGDYVVVQSSGPNGYLPAPDTLVPGVIAGETTSITVVNELGATLLIHTLNEEGDPVPGGCFTLYTDTGNGTRGDQVTGSCDYHDEADDGTTALSGLPTGDYVVVETQAPEGYLRADDHPVSGVVAGQTTETTVINVLGGTVMIHSANAAGDPLPGACFQIWTDAGDGVLGTYAGASCDYFDDADDGVTAIGGVPTGDYVVVEFQVPEGYLLAPNQRVHVVVSVTIGVDVVHNGA
jgi:uncharacterized surface anchored protein